MTSTIGEELINHLTFDGDVAFIVDNRIFQGTVPQKEDLPAIWFQRRAENTPLTLDAVAGITETDFDVECLSDAHTPEEAIDLAGKVKASLHGKSSDFGTGAVVARGVFVNDKDDTYEPKGNASDDGIHVVALDVKIWHR